MDGLRRNNLNAYKDLTMSVYSPTIFGTTACATSELGNIPSLKDKNCQYAYEKVKDFFPLRLSITLWRPHMEARGNLAGVRILVDTYNLRLPTGTGIKTYGLSLIEALQRLQVEISLLTDIRKSKTRYPQLDEVLVYDAKPRVRQRWLRAGTSGLFLLKSVFKQSKVECIQ